MKFGKYRGVLIADLPDEYLIWLRNLEDLREPLRSAVTAEWRARFAPIVGVPPLPNDVRAMTQELVATGYRALAQRHHPDHGGKGRNMQLVNAAAEWARRVLRGAVAS